MPFKFALCRNRENAEHSFEKRAITLKRCGLATALVLYASISSAAQISAPSVPDNGPTPSSPLGIPPHSSSAGTYEAVSPMNGSLNVSIPLLSLPQRAGTRLFLALVHHSNAYEHKQLTSVSSTTSTADGIPVVVDAISYSDYMATNDKPLEINLPRLQFSYEYVGDHAFYSADSITHVDNIYCATNFAFTDWSGNKHPFENVSTCNWHLGGPNTPMVDLTDSSDGSFYRLDTSTQTDIKVYSKDGTVYHFYGFSNLFPDNSTAIDDFHNYENYYDRRAGSVVDPNGNSISIIGSAGTYTLTDELGRTVNISPGAVSYKDNSGVQQTISITSTLLDDTDTYGSGFSCHYNGKIQISPYITPKVSSFDYLSGTRKTTSVSIVFPVAGSGQKAYTLLFDAINRITKITYPSGGYSRYEYGDDWGYKLNGDVQCTHINTGQVSKKYECLDSTGSCTEAVTSYTPTIYDEGDFSYNSLMKITHPLSDYETHAFNTTNAMRTNPQEIDTKTYDPDGTLLAWTHNDYPSITQSSYSRVSFDFDFPTMTTTTLYGGASPVSSTTSYTYATYSALPWYQSGIIDNPTEIDTTDYDGTVISKVSNQWMDPSSFTSSNHILDRLNWKSITDASGKIMSKTTYGYDVAGNVTSKTTTGTAIASNLTRYGRNGRGDITSVTDPIGNVTTIDYTDAWSNAGGTCIAAGLQAYPTKVTNALKHNTTYIYDSCLGTINSVTDPNGSVTNYTHDALGRIVCMATKDANDTVVAEKCDSYIDSAPSSFTESVTRTSTSSIDSKTELDGFGRIIKSSLTSDPSGATVVDTTYDADGRKQSVSSPYRSITESTYGIISYSYDGMGRLKHQCQADNSASASTTCAPDLSYLEWSYLGNVTSFRDENGNKWSRTTDALGRLTKVLEPSGTSATATLESDYSYDVLGNLLKVVQAGKTGSTARTRTFVYDGLSRLLCASNPENSGAPCPSTATTTYITGTTGYSYDADGNVTSRTDARGIVTTYKYDVLNRLLSKNYSDKNTASSCYQYDADSVPNGIGRLSASWTQAASVGNCPQSAPVSGFITKKAVAGYDGAGRLLSEKQLTPAAVANGLTYAPSYTYDLAGDVLTSTDGTTALPNAPNAMLGFTRSYDDAGHLMSLTSSWSDSTHPSSLFTAKSTANAPCSNSSKASDAYAAFGGIQNAVLGGGVLTVNRAYDVRARLNCELDFGGINSAATSGSAIVTITGAEQTK